MNRDSVLPEVQIQVRAADTLLYSLPVWLICHGAGLSVRLHTAPHQRTVDAHAQQHLPPTCQVSGIEVVQLMAVLELLHEKWPVAGVWPSDLTIRTCARDACAGIVSLCSGSNPFLLSLPEAAVCADPLLSEVVCSTMKDTAARIPGGPCSVTALAAVAHLLGIRGLLDRSARYMVQTALDGEAAQAWFSEAAVRKRLRHFRCESNLSLGNLKGLPR